MAEEPKSEGLALSRSASDVLGFAMALHQKIDNRSLSAKLVVWGLLRTGTQYGGDGIGFLEAHLQKWGIPDALDWYEQLHGFQGERHLQPLPSARSLLHGSGSPMSSFLGDTINCYKGAGGVGEIRAIHILGAILLGRNRLVHTERAGFERGGVDVEKLATAFLEFVAHSLPEQHERWIRWAAPGRSSPDASVGSARPQGSPESTPALSLSDAEPHVQQALVAAKQFADGGPLHARHVLVAIKALNDATPPVSSAAFRYLLSLVQLPEVKLQKLGPLNEELGRGIPLWPELQRQLAYAQRPEGYKFRTANARKIWGRDLVTAALLSGGGDLRTFAAGTGTSVGRLRDAWYEYITKEKKGLSREHVDRWWAFAGIPLPGQAPEPVPQTAEPAPAQEPVSPEFDSWPALDPPKFDSWHALDPPMQRAVSYAYAAAVQKAGSPNVLVAVRELLCGLLKEGGNTLIEALPAFTVERCSQKFNLPVLTRFLPLNDLPARTDGVRRTLLRVLDAKTRRSGVSLADATFIALFEPNEVGGFAPIDEITRELEIDAEETLAALEKQLEARAHPALPMVRAVRQMRLAGIEAWNRPQLDSDLVGRAIKPDEDLLDASKPARRLAKLLAAKDVHPPIALGLFGNWGSGKTFFMGLMREHIEDLTSKRDKAYVGRAVQIDFNAWHYHDTNLWASLAMRIFDELARELGGKEPTDVEKKRRELHQQMESSKARKIEATERREKALAQRSEVAKELDDKRAEREALRDKGVALRLGAAWELVKEGKDFAQLRDAAKTLSDKFGISAVLKTAKDLDKLKREVGATASQASGLLTAVGHRFRGSRVWGTVGVLIFAGVCVLALGWGVDKAVDAIKLKVPRFSATLVQVAGLASAAIAWCGRRIKDVHGVLEKITKVEEDLASKEKKAVETDELKKLTEDLATLDKEIHQRGEELGAAEREIAAATAELDRINQGGMVYDFLQGRRVAAPYLGQLGLISTIRQDFEKLDILLRDFATEGKDPIERVVLYIDDLDRCHPDKVVEVLQAVHLLLAFKLFNVVVGVDARWLERSLNRQYVGKKDEQKGTDEFSPQDYLEKIFQIPYALGPIGETNFKSLIGGMIETRTDRRAKEEKKRKEEDERKRAEEAARARAAAQAAQPVERAADAAPEGRPGPQPPVTPTEQTELAAGSESGNGQAAGDAGSEPAGNASANGEAEVAAFFEDYEEEFIERLHAFVDRPRLAKRLVNIYRLLRVRADDEGSRSPFLESSSDGEYRAALVLLAINVGHPRIGPKLMRAVELAAADQRWPDLLDGIVTTKGKPALVWSDVERRELATVAAKLQAMDAGRKDGPPVALTAYKEWAPKVACYSFDWHRDSPPALSGPGTRSRARE